MIASRLTLTCSLALLPVAALPAHGGQYRGPSSAGPSSSGAAPGQNQTGSLGSVQPGQSSVPVPGTGGGSGGAAGGAAAGAPARGAAPRGYVVGDDGTSWVFWWEFGKDPYVRLREAIYDRRQPDDGAALLGGQAAAARVIQRPRGDDLRRVASSLSATLSETDDRDLVSSCLIALAKIGAERAGFDVCAQFAPFLQRRDQEHRETAALAFGISGDLSEANVQRLADLIADTPAGRKLSGGVAVNPRTRAFAAYSAGLLLRRSRDVKTSMRLLEPLRALLAAPEQHDRNLAVAAIEAAAQLPLEWDSRGADVLRRSVADLLFAFYERDLGAGDQLMQAHVPTALAGLVARDGREAQRYREAFQRDLRAGLRGQAGGAAAKVNDHVAQSCALALGTLSAPWDGPMSPSDAVANDLVRAFRDHRDQQTRSFCVLALARMGGAAARRLLLAELPDANKALEQPWIAVALGVMAERQREGETRARFEAEDLELTRALVDAFDKARNPSTAAALAVALGLSGAAEARDLLRERLVANRKRDEVAGYVALALGLLRDARAVPDLRELRRDAVRRPFVLLQAVRALGMIGDHTVTDELCAELLAENQGLARLSAIAQALGQIGDRRSLQPLLTVMQDRAVTPLTRAFAAVALGSVCDKDDLSWNAAYASDVNYRAATETLTDGTTGILDLL